MERLKLLNMMAIKLCVLFGAIGFVASWFGSAQWIGWSIMLSSGGALISFLLDAIIEADEHDPESFYNQTKGY